MVEPGEQEDEQYLEERHGNGHSRESDQVECRKRLLDAGKRADAPVHAQYRQYGAADHAGGFRVFPVHASPLEGMRRTEMIAV
jgi:hypothetical protein